MDTTIASEAAFAVHDHAFLDVIGPAPRMERVDLGALKGNIGDQNYAIPGRTRLAAYRSVVVWCERFSVPFAAARV